jgi:hypothetical protein
LTIYRSITAEIAILAGEVLEAAVIDRRFNSVR